MAQWVRPLCQEPFWPWWPEVRTPAVPFFFFFFFSFIFIIFFNYHHLFLCNWPISIYFKDVQDIFMGKISVSCYIFDGFGCAQEPRMAVSAQRVIHATNEWVVVRAKLQFLSMYLEERVGQKSVFLFLTYATGTGCFRKRRKLMICFCGHAKVMYMRLVIGTDLVFRGP